MGGTLSSPSFMSRSNKPLYKADLMAGRDPEESNYILGKRYSIDDAKRMIKYLEERVREDGLYKEDQYTILERG
jgi:hypothetical protein